MIALTAAEVAEATSGTLHGPVDALVDGPVVTDSRAVVPGSLFAAIAGEHVDGHDFAAGAAHDGATVLLVEHEPADVRTPGAAVVVVPDTTRALGLLAAHVLRRLRASGELTVVAVTGSVGKTTTKDLLAQVLGASGPTVAPVASFNNELGLPLTVLRADETTRYLVLEMGANHVGELTYLTSIAPPDLSVVLAVGRAHVGEFGGIEAVARAKSELVTGLAPGGTAVLNADDLRVAAMSALAPGDVVTFGTVRDATVRADEVRVDALGRPGFVLTDTTTGESAAVTLLLTGEHHVSNALATAAVALRAGLDVAEVAARLSEAAALSPHRMQVTERADGVTVIDDSYNANPDSMRAALKGLAVVAGRGRRSIAVLGEMLELGEDSRAQHDEVGRLAVRLNIKLVIVVGAGASGIFDGVTQEGSWGDEAVFVDSIDGARAVLGTELRDGDVVLLKASNGAGLWRLGDDLVGAGVAS